MKHKFIFVLIPTVLLSLTSCDLLSGLFGGGDDSSVHKESFEPITGKFILVEEIDTRVEYHDTYFVFDGSKGNFTMKYYENGALKKQGEFQRVVTYEKYIGLKQNNLHFNIKCGKDYEHIGTYTESLDPIDQFRIVEEYNGSESKYFFSELPFVMGTYVREGKEYKKETLNKSQTDYTVPTRENFTACLNGKYALDETHYFYFFYPEVNSYYAKSYFQYYSPELSKPIEGFAAGRTYTNLDNVPTMIFTYSRQVSLYKAGGQTDEGGIYFGYYSESVSGRLVEHWGSVDFSNGNLNSFTFEHLSRYWTDEEMDRWTRDESYHLPDPILYEYEGGTYSKIKV